MHRLGLAVLRFCLHLVEDWPLKALGVARLCTVRLSIHAALPSQVLAKALQQSRPRDHPKQKDSHRELVDILRCVAL